ncbi:MAG: substrate-binding domain-containing protein [Acidimicrobiales bacterium]
MKQARLKGRVRRRFARCSVICGVAFLAASCSSASPSSTSGTKTSSTDITGGTASVACAGSLTKLYGTTLGPKFAEATGDHFGGPPCAGSSDLAQEIKSKAISPGVFLAVGVSPIETLIPTRAKFVINLATDPLVVAYSAKSRDASQLDAIASGSKPVSDLFRLMATPGFKLGRTDPTQDPQGEFFILMMELAQTSLDLPAGEADAILGISPSSPYGAASQQFDEDVLPSDELEGEVDAGSSYLSEALQYGLKYITLPSDLNFSDPADASTYSSVHLEVSGAAVKGTLVTLDATLVLPAPGTTVSAADQSADDAFVTYLLSSAGRAVLHTAGYTVQAPTIVLAGGETTTSALPTSVLAAFDGDHGVMAT